ncbi:MAG: aminopeptidase [Oscillospiraceae bacterium]|nr:aminopeptidase [Oscillospiraceae bacterium]
MNLESCKEEYAELIVCGGVRLKSGERVLINSDVATQEMARRVAQACYENGAAKVEIRWTDSHLDRMSLRYADEDVLKTVSSWEELQMKEQADELPCLIHLLSSDPMEGGSFYADKQAVVRSARLQVLLPHILRMRNRYKWTAVCVPTQAWADMVFPDQKNNLEQLWTDVLTAVMVNGDGTSIQKWQTKLENMWAHMDVLNHLSLRKLHLESELGTDLWVELHPKVRFCCASGPEDEAFVNIPSEEIFTSPVAGKAEGTLVASCPLIHENNYVDNLKLRFRNGAVTEVSATEGEVFFRNLVQADEGAARLGEVAIVDRHAPVKGLGHLMYHTLYDENAACHIAVGHGFNFAVEDYKTCTPEEIADCGVNQSGIHCDVMWGTDQARITGITASGDSVTILADGEWQI